MSTYRILHLTDLHLAEPAAPGLDAKVPVPGISKDYDRAEAFADTLAAFAEYMEGAGKTLDAVVVSGDITSRNQPNGFEKLNGVLGRLGSLLPPPSRIVVIPGNHDVLWGTAPGAPSRYRAFAKAFSHTGYVLPFLDGTTRTKASISRNLVLDTASRVLILPVNTSNWCGTPVTDSTGANATYDIARVSGEQMKFIRELLGLARSKVGYRRMTVIAVGHHHLLPVSHAEEVKPFESLTNLEAVRALLAEEGVDLYLHGHKHFRRAFWDHPYTADGDIRTLLISAGSTLDGSDTTFSASAQLVELDAGLPPRHLSTTPVPMRRHGGKLNKLGPAESHVLGVPDVTTSPSEPLKVSADDLDTVYSEVLALFAARSDMTEPILNLTCHVRRPQDHLELPAAYPQDIPGMEGRPSDWLKDIAQWWQHSELYPSASPRFNHGQRLHANSQLQRMASALRQHHKSGRALAVLVDPLIDDVGDVELRFPSFTVLQVELNQSSSGWLLHGIGYFRKHEMKYWWPVNIAEIVLVLTGLAERLRNDLNGPISIGGITTHSATAQSRQLAAPTLAPTGSDRLVQLQRSP